MSMGVSTMDTLSILERLESAGFERDKATVLAKEISVNIDLQIWLNQTTERTMDACATYLKQG